MKGHDQVVSLLNDILTAELTAINQYFIHARMCENWGYKRLWKKLREESIGEMRHADRLIERILYLEGVPNVQRLGKVNVGQTAPEQLRLDLELEQARARTEPELAVVIEADTDVLHGRVVNVMDAARLAGVGKLAIAVTPRETKR